VRREPGGGGEEQAAVEVQGLLVVRRMSRDDREKQTADLGYLIMRGGDGSGVTTQVVLTAGGMDELLHHD
jgi:hypothetical protein